MFKQKKKLVFYFIAAFLVTFIGINLFFYFTEKPKAEGCINLGPDSVEIKELIIGDNGFNKDKILVSSEKLARIKVINRSSKVHRVLLIVPTEKPAVIGTLFLSPKESGFFQVINTSKTLPTQKEFNFRELLISCTTCELNSTTRILPEVSQT